MRWSRRRHQRARKQARLEAAAKRWEWLAKLRAGDPKTIRQARKIAGFHLLYGAWGPEVGRLLGLTPNAQSLPRKTIDNLNPKERAIVEKYRDKIIAVPPLTPIKRKKEARR